MVEHVLAVVAQTALYVFVPWATLEVYVKPVSKICFFIIPKGIDGHEIYKMRW